VVTSDECDASRVQVCALWQQGLQVADEPRCEVVSGKIPAEAFSQTCCVCRKQVLRQA
jgi:hypothetical protein